MHNTIISTSGIGKVLILIFLLIGSIAADETSANQTATENSDNDNWVDVLKRYLFLNYDKYTRPLYNSQPTNVSLALTVHHADVDELKGTITIYGWLHMQWHDDKFKWDPKDYSNLSQIHLAGHEIWHPDLSPFNSATGGNIDHFGDTLSIAYYSGSVLWVPPYQFNVFCNLNLRLWPFDKQKCNLKLGAWTFGEIYVNVDRQSKEYDGNDAVIDHRVESHEWNIVSIKASRESDKYYNYINYVLELERRSGMYKAVIFTPASCVILLALAAFWLPPQAGEKIMLNGIIILLISALLMYFAGLLPVLAQSTPLVVLFYSSSLILVSISMIISVLVMYISSKKHTRRIPNGLKNILNGPVGTILFLSHLSPDVLPRSDKDLHEQPFESLTNADATNQIIEVQSDTKLSIQYDWVIFATAIDRFFFLLYSLVFIVLATIYSV